MWSKKWVFPFDVPSDPLCFPLCSPASLYTGLHNELLIIPGPHWSSLRLLEPPPPPSPCAGWHGDPYGMTGPWSLWKCFYFTAPGSQKGEGWCTKLSFIAKSSGCMYFTIHVWLFLNSYYGKVLTSACRFQTNYGYNSARPFPFPVYGLMEKGPVPFLCFLHYNIKMYPVLSKKPRGLRLRCRLWPNLVTSPMQDSGSQKTADL